MRLLPSRSRGIFRGLVTRWVISRFGELQLLLREEAPHERRDRRSLFLEPTGAFQIGRENRILL